MLIEIDDIVDYNKETGLVKKKQTTHCICSFSVFTQFSYWLELESCASGMHRKEEKMVQLYLYSESIPKSNKQLVFIECNQIQATDVQGKFQLSEGML